jgi:hypothetical protein
MAEAEIIPTSQEGAAGVAGGTDAAAKAPEREASGEAAAPQGPGIARRVLERLIAWHPFILMAAAAGLAMFAWSVYPEKEAVVPPTPEEFYHEGLDRLYRAINPDLPLIAASPAEEAMAARNAFMNLFVFHRRELPSIPEFINPHLLLAEANRILAEANPDPAANHQADAIASYGEAALWEKMLRPTDNAAAYAAANYLDRRDWTPEAASSPEEFLAENDDEIRLRRERRDEYIRYRIAGADIAQRHPELALAVLTEIQRGIDDRRREELRRSIGDEARGGDLPRRAFELGPEEYDSISMLIARASDDMGLREQAKHWYLRYLSTEPESRDIPLVTERLAAIYRDEGEIYRRVNTEQAAAAYAAAAGYYASLAASSAATREQRETAVLGLAEVNSRLADLTPAGEPAGTDKLSLVGAALKGWLEEFSGQPLPSRTLAAPLAVGNLLSKPELALPLPHVPASAMAGSLVAMAGGGMATPLEQRRRYLSLAMENYDRAAGYLGEGETRDRALVLAARESWRLGLKRETRERLEKMLDPLSSPELILAARLGLAVAAIDSGDLRKAGLLILGGRMHPLPLWFSAGDADWRTLAASLGRPANQAAPGVWRVLWDAISPEGREIARYAASGRRLNDAYVDRFVRAMNEVLRRSDFYRADNFPPGERDADLESLLARPAEMLAHDEMVWRNRLLLEEALPYDLARKGSAGTIGYPPFPPAAELPPGGLVDPDEVRDMLLALAEKWGEPPEASATLADRARRLVESAAAYQAALSRYRGDSGEINHALALNRERLADIREAQGRSLEALPLTAEAARRYLDVSLLAEGSPREMQSLLNAGDAFFRAGLLERTVESMERFMERFGHASVPGAESTMAVSLALNLLGRAQWFLNDPAGAIRSFQRNIAIRSPERFKAIYFIGRVLLDEGEAKDDPALLGSDADPLPELDRNNDPVIATALQAFNYLRQSQGISPIARVWRWSSFDLAKLRHAMAERARRQAEGGGAAVPASSGIGREGEDDSPWLALYDRARENLTEALGRYPLTRNGGNGLSVRVEPADYADVMAARFEAEFLLAKTLLVLADGRNDDSLAALARVHLENLKDRRRYAAALFDTSLNRFQLNAAIIREELGGDGEPLERSRLGDDDGPVRSPSVYRPMLRNAMLLLANEYFRAGEKALAREDGESGDAAGFYRRSYAVYQDIHDRFGDAYGAQAMVGMGDNMARLGQADIAANHYRMARNIAAAAPAGESGGDSVNTGPEFWGGMAEARLRDMEAGYRTP